MRWTTVLIGTVLTVFAAGVLVLASRPSGTAVVDLVVGECFELPAGLDAGERPVAVVAAVAVVDCAAPHDAEVVLVGVVNPDHDREYPSDAELFDELDQRCATVAGRIRPGFGVLPIGPDLATWRRLEGRFHCVALPLGGGRTTAAAMVD